MHEAFAVYSTGQPSGALVETPASLEAEVAQGTSIAAAFIDDRIVAMVKHRLASDDTLSFGRLAVIPDRQGQGLARALLEALRAYAKTTGLQGLSCYVRAAETANIARYERLGMVVVEHLEKASLTGAVIPVVRMADANAD